MIVSIIACFAQPPKVMDREAPKAKVEVGTSQATGSPRYVQEKTLKSLSQLTYRGDNAEGYFSFDNSKLVFQASKEEWVAKCEQDFIMPLTGITYAITPALLRTGLVMTNCPYIMPGDSTVPDASTRLADEACPEFQKFMEGKYVSPIYESFDIIVSDISGKIAKILTVDPGYDMELALSPEGKMIVFTSMYPGDLGLPTMNINEEGSDLKQITFDDIFDAFSSNKNNGCTIETNVFLT